MSTFERLVLRALATLIQFQLWDYSSEKIATHPGLAEANRLKDELNEVSRHS